MIGTTHQRSSSEDNVYQTRSRGALGSDSNRRRPGQCGHYDYPAPPHHPGGAPAPSAAPPIPEGPWIQTSSAKNCFNLHGFLYVFTLEQVQGGNYVLDRDELVEAQTPEYDVVLCLSLTKWVHLNSGDEGLKHMFRQIYRHLRPGGILVLELQPWSSYGKRKTLTETIYKNYYRIQLKPEQFISYLTSPEVGFSSYELVATPHNTSNGLQWPPASCVPVPQGLFPQPLSGLLNRKCAEAACCS
ncbi:7SK snRNA methylphosphate capping enzyme isoform B [Camelus ferus]|nr:7SK snRNA methylphosphate capping enzyme isoform B [Camelus ferus]